MAVRVSACFIVKNEAAVLGAGTTSIADLAHEVIVTDTGSTDNTREIAADLAGAEVALVRMLEMDAAKNQSGDGQLAPKNQSGDKRRSPQNQSGDGCPPKNESGDGRRTPQSERHITARHNLALVYQRQGRVGEAEAQWRAVLAEKDDMQEAWKGLAELCVMQGRHAEAEMIIKKLEAGNHDEASLLRGRLHFERKEYADVPGP